MLLHDPVPRLPEEEEGKAAVGMRVVALVTILLAQASMVGVNAIYEQTCDWKTMAWNSVRLGATRHRFL